MSVNETQTSWFAIVLVLAALISGCSKAQEPSELYEIVSHGARGGDWVILKVDNEKHTRVEITVVCDFYQWGSRDRVEGDCDLPVGATLVPNRLGTRG
jgi:hypothetical protein